MKKLFLIAVISYIGCSDPHSGQLTEAEKAVVDSLYRKDIDTVRIYYDSLCTAQYDSIFNIAYDSIMQERIAEIENLQKIR